jgi:phosphoglycerate kinase
MAPGAPARVRDGRLDIDEHDRILDAGPETVERLCRAMDNSKTLIWNGPLGVFEMPPFDKAHHEGRGEARRRTGQGRQAGGRGRRR